MICSTCDAPVAVDSLKIWNSRTVCTDCFGVLSGQAAPSQPDPENLRTIRETTVCPACQAEFHKDHPVCPECNVVLDPAFRVARQTKRAVLEVSELVVENTRTTRQIFVYVLRLLIAGFLWALVVLSAVTLIVGVLSQRVTINWWGVPVSVMLFVTMIWLARRIGPGHFRPRSRLNNESASKPAADSSAVEETEPAADANSGHALGPQKIEKKSEIAPATVGRWPVVFALLFVWACLIVVPLLIILETQPETPGVATPNQGESLTSEVRPTPHQDHVDSPRESASIPYAALFELSDSLNAYADEVRDYQAQDQQRNSGRIARQRAFLQTLKLQEEAEEKARLQQLGTFEKVRETAANFLIPDSRK